MGGWWLLAAASSVPVPGKARVLQYSANFLQPFQSDSHAIVMPNVCCSQQLKDGRARQAEGCGEVDDSSLNTVRDLRDWFTLEGTQRVLRIRANHASTNLFTYLLTAINQLIVADAAGVTAYIDFSRCAVNGKDHPASGGSNPFHDPNYGDNMWEQYFDAVSTYSPQRTKTATGRRHHQRDVRSLSSARMWELRNQTASSVFTSAYGIYEQQAGRGYDGKWLKGMRERAAGIIKRHIRVKPVIATKVNAFWRGHFADSDRVLGLHIQRPQPEATPIGLEVYAAHIDRWLMAHPDASIFVVCEDSSFVPLLTQVYGDKLVVREARLQTNRDTLLEDHGEHYRRGEEALIDMLLLSKCTFLLKGDADVAEFAVYFNPKLSDNSIDLGYAKAATNPKAGAEVSAVTAAEESEALDAATLLTSDVGSRTAETPLETFLNFLVCETSLCHYGEGCGEYAALANASCIRTEAQIDARTETQKEIAERLQQVRPLASEAQELFAQMDVTMPLRSDLPRPKPVHLSLTKMTAALDIRSDLARKLATLNSPAMEASVDIVIVRCEEVVSPWLPRLISHFPHDIKVKVLIGEMCRDKCRRTAPLEKHGPPSRSAGLHEACESPRHHDVLGAKVEHRNFENVGFESAVYIKYIIDNIKSETLADSTLFLQAGWPQHSPRMLDSSVLEYHMSTSPFTMYGSLYEMLPQKGCTDWCLTSTVWKYTLPEKKAGFTDNGQVGNVGFGLFHAKRSVIEERSLESWELIHRALIGKHEPLNAELCAPLKNMGINMTSLLRSSYGKDLLLMIRGNGGPEVTTPLMVKRLGAMLDSDSHIFPGSSVLHSMRTRDRLATEIQSTSAICSQHKSVKHCPAGFQLGGDACDMSRMILSDGEHGDKPWPCCDMNGAAEDGVDQAMLSLHTRIFYCAAAYPEDRGKLMGTAYEHSWHMLFGQAATLPLTMAPMIETYAGVGNPAFLDSCPQKTSTILPTTDTFTRMAAHANHRQNIFLRVIRAGLQILQGADTQEGRSLCSSSSWSHTSTFKAACNWYASSKRLASGVSLSLATSGACTPVQMATRTLLRSTDLCSTGLVACNALEADALEKCAEPSHAQLHRTQNTYGTFRELFESLAETVAPQLRPTLSATVELAVRKSAAVLQSSGLNQLGSHDGRLDLVIARCHRGTFQSLRQLVGNFDHRLSVRTFVYERCVDNAEGHNSMQGSDVWLLPAAVDQRDLLFGVYRFAVAPHARNTSLDKLHASGVHQMRNIFGRTRPTAKSATLLVQDNVLECANPTTACDTSSTGLASIENRHSMALCLAEKAIETKFRDTIETSVEEDNSIEPLPSWVFETELEEKACAQPMPTIRVLGAVSLLLASTSHLFEGEQPSPYNAAASALDAERMMVEREAPSPGKRRVLGTPLSCFEPDFMMHNREMMSVAPLDPKVCSHNLSAVPPMVMKISSQHVKTQLLAAGWFSTVMGMVKPMMAAIATGRSLTTPSILEFTSNSTCPTRDMSCFFSSMADPSDEPAELVDIEDDPTIYSLSEAANSIPPAYSERGWFWWASKTIELIIRPSPAAAAAVRYESDATGLTAALDDGSPIMGLHVRQGDSCLAEEYIRMSRECSNLSTYMDAAMPMIKSAGVKYVYLATDSIQALTDTIMYPQLKFIHLNTTREPMTTTRHKLTLWDVRIKPLSPNETPAEEQRRLSSNMASAFDATVDVMLLSKADILVGKFTSNLFRSAYAMASARCDCIVPFISLDAPWCFDYGRRVGANWDFPVDGGVNHTKSDNRFYC